MTTLKSYANWALRYGHSRLGHDYELYIGNSADDAALLSHSDGTQADLEPLAVDAAIRLGLAPDDAEAAQEIWAARLRQSDFADTDLPVNATYWVSADGGLTKRAFKSRKRTESKVQGLEWELILVRG
ncbi:MAG: hypothetical protein AAFO83_00940 [Cyanobacteria bacterium J06607_13]